MSWHMTASAGGIRHLGILLLSQRLLVIVVPPSCPRLSFLLPLLEDLKACINALKTSLSTCNVAD